VRASALLLVAACAPTGDHRCRDAIAPGELVITEVLADPSGPDEGQEWFELYNATDRPLELAGLAIVHSRLDGSSLAVHHVTESTILPGQYATFGNTAGPVGFVDYGYGGDLGELYNTGGGKLALECGNTTIDLASYDSVVEGHSRELAAGKLDATDDPASWCECDATKFGGGDFGTPRFASDCTPLGPGQCTEGGAARAIRKPAMGALAITEIMPNPKVEPAEEWFEIENVGGTEFDLNELLLDRAGDTRAAETIHSDACKPVAPGAFAVFARSSDAASNGMLPPIDATFSFSLVNRDGDVRVLDGATVLDAVTWTTSTDGVSAQLVPDACPGVTPYGDQQNLGTPKAPNRCR
jgi:hypothetical protein